MSNQENDPLEKMVWSDLIIPFTEVLVNYASDEWTRKGG